MILLFLSLKTEVSGASILAGAFLYADVSLFYT